MKTHHAILPALLALSTALAIQPTRTPEHDYDAPKPGSYTLPVIKHATDGALLDSGGATTSLREITRGRVTVLSFIYTRCTDARACPYATGVLLQLHAASRNNPVLADSLRLVSMSFDPEHDTPARLRDYAALAVTPQAAAEWRFVTAHSRAALLPVLAAYGQSVAPRENAADPLGPLHHNLRVLLVDAEGRIRNIYSSGTLDPRIVLADVQTLLMESKSQTAASK